MKALRQTQPSFAKTFRAPRLLVSSSRSRPQTRGNESAQHKLSLPNNLSAVEKLARTAEARLVELIGAETVNRAEKLFDQQLWLWGQDVARVPGNGLIGFGFKRYPPPAAMQGSSCYILDASRGRQVGLWGFGTFYSEKGVGGLFLKRFFFGPCVADGVERPPTCWALDQWPAHRVPTTPEDWSVAQKLLDGFLGWIAEYEHWLERHAPHLHRTECLRDWKQRYLNGENVASEWEILRRKMLREKTE